MLIKGIVKDCLYNISTTTTGDSYAKIAGVSRNGRLAHAGVNGKNYTGYAILTNTQDYTSSGIMTETSYPYFWTPSSGKLCIVMNGTASQTFTSNGLFFFGGVKAMSGTLKMNFKQSADQYWYKSGDNKYRVTAAAKDGEGVYSATQFSHGNLEMLGGTFSSDATTNYGQFRFTNIIYTDGQIVLRLNSASQMDTITLENYYNASTAVADVSSVTYEEVAGGTVSKTEGAEKVTFNFGDNLTWLIDAANDGVKVIAWNTKSALTADDFDANIFTNADGDKYRALFAVNNDGLYVKYVAVPEPATVAAIFGALAIALAVYRKRK